MKKLKVALVSLILCCALLLCLSACKDPSDPDDSQPKVTQYEEFSGILTNVIAKFAPPKEESGVSVAQLAVVGSGSANESVGTIQKLAVDNVFENLDEQTGLENSELYSKNMNTIAFNNLLMVQSYVRTLHEVHKVDNVYDVPMRLMPQSDSEDKTQVNYSGGYAIVKSKDTHKIMYLYNKEGDKEVVYKFDIDYKSKENFTATMIMIAMDGEVVVNNIEEKSANSYYFFGDTNDRALYMVGNWTEQDKSKVVAYKNGADCAVKFTQDSEIANNCFKMLYSDYSNIDLTVARSAAGAEKSFTQAQFKDVLKKLVEEYGYTL